MPFQFSLEFGWAADPIKDQIKAYGITIDDPVTMMCENWQGLADSALMLSLHSYLKDSEAIRIRNKITRESKKWLIKNKYMAKSI